MRALLSVGAGAILNAALAGITGIAIARTLGPHGQGVFSVVVTVASIVLLICTCGTGAALRVRSRTAPSAEDLASYTSFSLTMAVVAGMVTALAARAVAGGDIRSFDLVLVLLYGMTLFLGRQAAEAIQSYGWVSQSILSQAAAAATQLAVYTVGSAMTGPSLGLALVAGACGPLGQIAHCGALLTSRGGWTPKLGYGAVRSMVRQGFPTLGFGLGLLVLQRLDRLLLASLAGPGVTGLYTAAATIAEVTRLIPTSAGQLLFARVAAHQGYDRGSRRIFLIQVLVLLTACTISLTLGPWITFLLGPAYAEAVPIFRGLVVAEFFMGIATMDSRIIMGMGRLKAVGGYSLILLILSLPVYFFLIRLFAAQGAVAGSIFLYGAYSFALNRYRRALTPLGKHHRIT